MAIAQRTVTCHENEFCDTLDEMGLVLIKHNGDTVRVHGTMGGPYYVVKEEIAEVFIKYARCHYCTGKTYWVLRNKQGSKYKAKTVELKDYQKRVHISDFMQLPNDTYTINIMVPMAFEWKWTIVLRNAQKEEKKIQHELPTGWSFNYNYHGYGFDIGKNDSVEYHNLYYILNQKKGQTPKFYEDLEQLVRLDSRYNHPNRTDELILTFNWGYPLNYHHESYSKNQSDSTLEFWYNEFLKDTTYHAYFDYVKALYVFSNAPYIFSPRATRKLSIFTLYCALENMKRDDAAEIEEMLTWLEAKLK